MIWHLILAVGYVIIAILWYGLIFFKNEAFYWYLAYSIGSLAGWWMVILDWQEGKWVKPISRMKNLIFLPVLLVLVIWWSLTDDSEDPDDCGYLP